MLWSGLTHSVLGAPVNSTCYIKKIVNCTIKQSGKKSLTKCCKGHLNIYIENASHKCNTITVTISGNLTLWVNV